MSRPARRLRRGLRAIVVNPVATIVLLMLLWVEVDRLRDYEGIWQRSALVMLVRGQDPPAPGALETTRQIYIDRGEGAEPEWRFLEPDRESWDEATRLLIERPGDVVTAEYTQESYTTGLVHPTQLHERHVLRTEVEFGGEFSPEEIAAAREAVAKHLGIGQRAARDLMQMDEAGEARIERRSLGLRGYVLNLYLVALLAGCIGSLLWIPAAMRGVRRLRQQHAIARGRCPHCGYSMAGAEDDVCPECGRSTRLPDQ